jgi:hypothetical protein
LLATGWVPALATKHSSTATDLMQINALMDPVAAGWLALGVGLFAEYGGYVK